MSCPSLLLQLAWWDSCRSEVFAKNGHDLREGHRTGIGCADALFGVGARPATSRGEICRSAGRLLGGCDSLRPRGSQTLSLRRDQGVTEGDRRVDHGLVAD